MLTLMPFQETGRDFLAMRTNAILADDMGLGKTLMAIEAMKTCKISSGLVICPLSVRRTWVKVLLEQFPGASIQELTSTRSIPNPQSINVVNYDIAWRGKLIDQLRSVRWKVLIADESHYLKTMEAKRTKALLGKGGLHNVCDRRWMMTGTPILNRPIELYPILRSLCPERLGSFQDYYRYAYKFCAGFQDNFGFNADGASNLEELSKILGPFMLRRMKEDVLDQLPPIQYEKIYLDPSDQLMAMVKREEKSDIDEAGSIRHAIGLLKVKPAILHLEDLLLSKPKVVVFTWHKDVANKIKDHFKDGAVLFTGEQNVSEKEAAKQDFIENPKVKVFIGQLEAAGIGVDGLQKVCDTCLFVEMYSVPGKIKQAVDRLRRIGQNSSVTAQFLIVEDSVDEKIVNSLIDKSTNIKTILNEKGGPNFVKFVCHVCRKPVEMAALRRVAGMSVCKSCETTLEVLL